MTLTVATVVYAKDDRLSFDIPAQSLASALDAYVTATNIETFYDSELARTRRSTAVKGILAPDVALRVLLEGTGLTEVLTGKAFAVVAASRPTQYGGARLSEFGPYYNALQVGVARAFCRHVETTPGDYRAVIRFSVGSSGELQGLNLLSSTGEIRSSPTSCAA
ncbi:STN domain-containing protein [Tardiphaga sp. 42S5]|uniref:STN domain-containing protein n=1 Tax=Tardiphaga sp. 42S5 TaxID=1404799 RepID=UPI002A59E196|nr:STN domain-containing protein [Tardiphaga sp. 42S5]WPO40259.1 STN domain-containing protein [Tardiphaga sp. 42S5]